MRGGAVPLPHETKKSPEVIKRELEIVEKLRLQKKSKKVVRHIGTHYFLGTSMHARTKLQLLQDVTISYPVSGRCPPHRAEAAARRPPPPPQRC